MEEEYGLYCDKDVKNNLPSHLGSFILSISKTLMNIIFREINGFHNLGIYYTDTDSSYMEKKHWRVLHKRG